MIIEIPIKCPSWNNYLRMHYHERDKLNNEIYLLVKIKTRKFFKTSKLTYYNSPVKITVTAYYTYNKRHDPDNVCAKPFIDGLVKNNIISDDNCKLVNGVLTRCMIGAQEDKTIIEVDLDI